MFTVLSFGGGVNSTAAMILLKPEHLIFADTGDEHPDTYSFIENVAKPYIAGYGGEFIVVRNPKWARLQDQAFAEKIIPVRINRWCTDRFKIRPIRAYLKVHGLLPAKQLIAIDAGEAHRAKPSDRLDIENCFPLVDRGLDRDDCIEIIRLEGLPVPRKSGCFYCPFSSKPQWIALKREHPELYQIAVAMESNGSNFGKLFLAAKDKPLDEWLVSGRIREGDAEQRELDLDAALPCSCYDG